jgi:DNA-binding IclR family transcriptional regulator
MTSLDISQSAASRSLTQLTANGYLVERRREGGKSYTLNPARLEDTLAAICRFLGLPTPVRIQP